MKRSSLKRKEKYSKKSVGFDSESSHVNKTFAQVKELNRQLKKTKPKPVWPKLVLPVLLALLIIGTGLFMITPVFTGLSVENVTNESSNITYKDIINISEDTIENISLNLSVNTTLNMSLNTSIENVTLDGGVEPNIEQLNETVLQVAPPLKTKGSKELTNRYRGASRKLKFKFEGREIRGNKQRMRKATLDKPLRMIEKIEFRNLEVNQDEIALGIEEVSMPQFEQSYAIDPTEINFTDAEVTVTAKGKTLMKCKDWNFQEQSCEGEWEVFKTDLVPGEPYTFTLTPDDPGFGELPEFNVQRNIVTGTGTTITDTLTVNNDTAFVLFRANTGDATPDDSQFTPDLSTSQVSFTRYDGAALSSSIAYQVVDSSFLSVQRGEIALTSGTASTDITISAVNLSESFVIVYGRCADETTGDNHAGFFFGNLTSSTNIHLERGNAGKCAATVSYQVVEWDGASVQSGTSIIANSQDSTTASISSVDTSASFLIFGSASIGTDPGMDSNLIRGNISSANQLDFTHEPGSTYSSAERRIVWYVVELPDAFVQSGNVALSADTTDTVTAVNTSKAFHVSSGWNTGGGQTYTNSLYTIALTDSTTLTFDKQTTSQTQNIIWQLIEVDPAVVVWPSPSLDLSIGSLSGGNLTGSATLTTISDHTNVVISCISGNCSDIVDDWSDGSSLSDGSSPEVNFTCINNTVGKLWAVFNLTTDDFLGYDLINVSCEFAAANYVAWNTSSIDLGSGLAGEGILSENASIFSNGANTDINVTCVSGNCTEITDSWIDSSSMSDQQSSEVNFTCDDSLAGNFTAVFEVQSAEDLTADSISISCDIIEPDYPPSVVLNSPENESNFTTDDLGITLNTTIYDDGLACVDIYGGTTLPPTGLLSSTCGLSNDTQTLYNWTSPVREDTSEIYCLYHFDNRSEFGESGTLVNDFGGNCNDATCSGGNCPTENISAGKFAGAYHYDGVDDFWNLGAATILDSAFTDQTIELWFKADTISGTTFRTLFEFGGGTNGINMYIYDSKLFAGAYCENCAPAWQGDWLNFTTTTDEWHYAAVIFDGNNNMTLVYDNQSKSVALTTAMNSHGGDNYIGQNGGTKFHTGDDGSDGERFHGYIDEFVVYSETAITLEQAEEHYRLINDTYYWYANVSDAQSSNTSDTWQFNVKLPIDITPPGTVTDLQNQSAQYTWIYWNWTNPTDPDFDHVEVWLDNVFQVNTSNNFFNATGLIENTWHTIQTRTADTSGNINTTWVNSTARTNTTDPIIPVINSFSDSPDPLAEGDNITFVVNATDNINVTQVLVQIDGTNYSMIQDTGFVGTPEQFFIDNFEDNDISDWTVTPGSTSGWYVTGTETPIGSYHTIARNTDSETTLEQTISTAGYDNITFAFWWSTDTNSFDAADYYIAEWYNGTGWTEVFNYGSGSSTTYQQASYALPDTADDLSSFAIRFRCNVNLGTEGCNVDNITLTGTNSQEAKPELWNFTFNTSGLGNGLQTYYLYALDAVNNSAINISNFTVIGTPNYSFYLVDPVDLLVDNQTTAVYLISLTNDGNVADSYNLAATNYDAADTASLNQTIISNLGAGQTAIVELSVASNTVGNYTVGVNATSVGNSSVTDAINTSTEIVPYVAPPSNSLFFDDFESGSLATEGWISEGTGTPWFIETVDTSFGTYHAEAAPGGSETIMRQNISTTGYGSITLSFYWDTDLLDAGEYLRVAWYNGSTWNTVLNTNTNPGSYQLFDLTLPSGAEDDPNFAIRFACLSNLPTEECKVDNVLVTGFDIANPNVTSVFPQGTYHEYNDTIDISAVVVDNINVSHVFAEVSWPEGSEIVELLDPEPDTNYTGNFTNISYYGKYNITIIANDTSSNINDSETGFFFVNAPVKIQNFTIAPDDDEFTDGSQINPLEDSNITVNITVNMTNTTELDTCLVRIFNSTDTFASPTIGPVTGVVSVVSGTTQCFAEWNMSYWRSVGDYNVSVDVNRTDGLSDQVNTSYYYNELKSFNINTSIIGFNSVPGTTTNSTTAYPLGVKNTGNVPLNISIDGTDFIGQSNPAFQIGIQNITYNETGTGLFLPLTHTLTDIPSMQYLQPTVIQSLYFRGYAPFGLLAQEYNSNITFSGQ